MSRSISKPEFVSQTLYKRKESRPLLKIFWSSLCILFIVTIPAIESPAFESVIAAILITVASLIPVYLWCSERVLGIPIFPIYALTFLWTYALPLVSDHPFVITYSSASHFVAGLTVSGFLGLATLIWMRITTSSIKPPSSYRVLEGNTSDWILLSSQIMNVIFLMSIVGGWFTLDGGLFPVLKGVIFGLSTLATFVIAHRLGQKELSKSKTILFLTLVIISIIANSVSLFLVGAISTVGLTAAGFIFGRRKVPWLALFLAVTCLVIFHYGKGAMRDKYWTEGQSNAVQPWEYPAWFAEWGGNAFQTIMDPTSVSDSRSNAFAERMSLIHLLLLAQEKTPNEAPYLYGATYAIIPELLVPRFINPDKAISHEGTSLLNINYGLQTRESTWTTTIGWGLLNESYANFGFFGCAGLAVILGSFYGYVTRWSIGVSPLSARTLFAILVLSTAYQSEFSAGVYVTVIFQQTVPLIALTLILMKIKNTNNHKKLQPEKESIT